MLSAADITAVALMHSLTHLHLPMVRMKQDEGLEELCTLPRLSSLTLDFLCFNMVDGLLCLRQSLTELLVLDMLNDVGLISLFETVSELHGLRKLHLAQHPYASPNSTLVGVLAGGCTNLQVRGLHTAHTRHFVSRLCP